MDTTAVLKELEKITGPAPIWNPAAENQTAEFDRWKSWSTKVSLRNALGALFKSREKPLSSGSMVATPSRGG